VEVHGAARGEEPEDLEVDRRQERDAEDVERRAGRLGRGRARRGALGAGDEVRLAEARLEPSEELAHEREGRIALELRGGLAGEALPYEPRAVVDEAIDRVGEGARDAERGAIARLAFAREEALEIGGLRDLRGQLGQEREDVEAERGRREAIGRGGRLVELDERLPEDLRGVSEAHVGRDAEAARERPIEPALHAVAAHRDLAAHEGIGRALALDPRGELARERLDALAEMEVE